MTFDEEMDKFFKPFSEEDRKKVEQTLAYRQAAAKEDAIKASEIANGLIVGTIDERGPLFLHRPVKYLKIKGPN
jgi:hypothetical protein